MSEKKIIIGISLLVVLGGLGLKFHPEKKPEPKEEPKVVVQEVIKPIPIVEVHTPIRKEIDDELIISGDVGAWQESIIGSELGGVRVDQILVDVGQLVEKNQVLAILSSETILADLNIAKAGVAEAQAYLKQAKENADRARSLDKTNALSVQQMNQYLTIETTAQAKLESAIAHLELKKVRMEQTKIKAPDSGIVSDRKVAVGNIVSSGEMFRIISQEKLQWKPQISLEKLDLISKGQDILITAKSGKTIRSKVSEISPKINTETRKATIIVNLTKDVHKGLVHSGMSLTGTIKLGKKKALMVNQKAIMRKGNDEYVFVLEDENKVNKTKVEIGKKEGELIEIVSGIDNKDKIVKTGWEELNDGDTVEILVKNKAK